MGTFYGLFLGGVDDVNRGFLIGHEFLDGFVVGFHRPQVLQRDGADDPGDDAGGAPGGGRQADGEVGDVTESGAHDDLLGLGKLGQWHLPGPAAVGVADEVELIHDDLVDAGVMALAQSDVSEDLGGAADDGGVGVDRGIPGDHADVGGSEDLAQAEEFLADESLDRGGVVGAPAGCDAREVGGGSDEGFPGSGRGSDNDVIPRQDFQYRLFLVLVHRDAVGGDGALDVV